MTIVNPMDLSGRTVLVTGASSGIGRETAVLLSQLGARLILIARDRARLEETALRLAGAGHIIESHDLSEPEPIMGWVKELGRRVGGLNGLVHAAGLHSIVPIRMLEPGELDGLWRINVAAAVQLVRGFRQKGVASRPSSVVLLASITGLTGQPGVSAYAATKGALIAFTKSAAMEMARENIRVNCVAPSLVKTAMTDRILKNLDEGQRSAVELLHPLGLGEPVDVANAIAFLLAETGRWITGTTLVVDGGFTAQ
ncbi:SDR family NAD(P)-dependent oxidoreductase [Isosphaeraceae bacterium EP7]